MLTGCLLGTASFPLAYHTVGRVVAILAARLPDCGYTAVVSSWQPPIRGPSATAGFSASAGRQPLFVNAIVNRRTEWPV
ncbi:hypothetical protein PJI17_13400 [Mycobacterium kansasii]